MKKFNDVKEKVVKLVKDHSNELLMTMSFAAGGLVIGGITYAAGIKNGRADGFEIIANAIANAGTDGLAIHDVDNTQWIFTATKCSEE